MIPVVTAEEMRTADARSGITENELLQRAGWHVARVAREMLGVTYGKCIAVIAGPGNNGNDGRVAAEFLRARGLHTSLYAPDELDDIKATKKLRDVDLIIDAAYGTSFHGDYCAPNVGTTPVLSVDIPSGVQCDTGVAAPHAVVAQKTVTFAALKPAHFLGDGPTHCGDVILCDIGVAVHEQANMWHFSDDDARAILPPRTRHAHKWNAAMTLVGGSAGMLGAPELVARGAMRAGAGMVHTLLPVEHAEFPVTEAVGIPTTLATLSTDVLQDVGRTDALVIGPGLGRSEEIEESVREIVARADVPVVIDGDALYAFRDIAQWSQLLRSRNNCTILTPHMGEFFRLGAHGEILHSVREVARATRATVLLKGPTTLVAQPDGAIFFVTSGGPRLATAGTGDVLAGMIGSFLSQGLDAAHACALGAHTHGRAAARGFSRGLIASDLPLLVAEVLSDLEIDREMMEHAHE